MSTIEETVPTQLLAPVGRLRSMLVVAALAVGLIGGFGLGRAARGGDSFVAPAIPVSGMVHQRPGHVPRYWMDTS